MCNKNLKNRIDHPIKVKKLHGFLFNNHFIKMNIDILAKFLKYGSDVSNTIIVSGAPRGGTTWLMEILATIKNYKTIFEPFHREWFPEVNEINLPRRPYLHPKEEHYQLKAYLNEVFKGKVVSLRPNYNLTPDNIYKRFFAENNIVKFTRANRLLPWIATNFDLRNIFLIIRHPCATVSSQLNSKVIPYFINDITLARKMILKEVQTIPNLKGDETLIKKLETLSSQVELLAARWSMDYYVTLNYPKPQWHTVVYEKLATDYNEETDKIFNLIGEDKPKEVNDKLNTPSSMTMFEDKKIVGSEFQLEKWKKKLSKKQIDQILNVTHWFDLDFYTIDAEPDYNLLNKRIKSIKGNIKTT